MAKIPITVEIEVEVACLEGEEDTWANVPVDVAKASLLRIFDISNMLADRIGHRLPGHTLGFTIKEVK